MFFIISSYLIIGILARSVNNENFSLRRFYFKRIIRTFPAFYTFLLVTFTILYLLGLFDWNQLWRAPFYLENYHPRSNWNHIQWFIGHSWSLAVEEQFYIIVSFLFYLFHKKYLSEYGIIKILFAVILIIPVIRIVYFFVPQIPIFLSGSIHRSFETVADALAVGGVAYFFQEKIRQLSIFKRLANNVGIICILIFLLVIVNSSALREFMGYGPRIFYNAIGITLLNFLLGILMLIVATFPLNSIFAKLLNSSPIVWIGIWSYSIYLWQQLWLYGGWELSFLFRIMAILFCSLASYYIIEKPFLSWRNKILNRPKLTKAAL